MIASLKSSSLATRMSCSSRRLRGSVLFQLTMKPSMPAALAHRTWVRMTVSSSLE